MNLEDVNILPAFLSTTRVSHSGLGTDSYVQVTSPIRRFGDMVSQQILWDVLLNRDLTFNQDYLLSILYKITEAQATYRKLEKSILDLWKLKYLAQNTQIKYTVKIKYASNTKVWVNIKQLDFTCEAFFNEMININSVGKVFTVQIQLVDLNRHKLKLKICSKK